MLTIDGLATGLDTTSIVEGLLSIKQNQIDRLNLRQQEILGKQAAFSGIEARLLGLQTSVSSLISAQNNLFGAKTAASSDDSIVDVSASDKATNGVYNLRVTSLARAHQIATQGLSDPESAITEGTLKLRVGAGPETTITIDSTNNTLAGLASAINSAQADVTASVISDGSGTSYRLLVAANKPGTENEITVVNNLGESTPEATKPSFDLVNPVQAATNASVSFGSGAGAITVSGSSNQIEDVIPGVTLDLRSIDAAKDITITIGDDIESITNAVTEFVDSFNSVMQFIDDQVRFEAETSQASPLLGNRSVVAIQDQVRRAVSEVVAGVATEANRLSAVGITFNNSGHLELNSAKLDDALSGRIEGVGIDDVRRLFVLDGQSDNGAIDYVLGSARTVESQTPYQVDVTQAAERATITATNALAASTIIDNTNNSFTISVDGKESSLLTLAEGTYTRDELASHLKAVIDGDDGLLGRSVSVTIENDRLKITSVLYGDSSEVTIGSGTAVTELGFDGSETDLGQDVAGSFLVNGVSEAAIGNGQRLVGNGENENTADLQVRVGLTSSQVQPGADANLTITRGIAARLEQVLNSLFDTGNGRIKAVNDSFDEQVEDIQATIERQTALFDARQEALLAEFIALETAVSQLQSTGSFLSAQLSAFSQLAPR